MDDKFILMGLDDDNSKDVADIIGNKTCKKILDFLAERKEASEKDIADGLNMKLNTTEYNLKKLIKAGFVEKAKNFFWSVKGKKIEVYKLAKKHIIISNKKPSLSYLKSILPVLLILLVGVILVGLLNLPVQDEKESDGLLKQFSSYDDLKEFVKTGSEDTGRGFFKGEMSNDVALESADKQAAAPTTAGGGEGASDYSTTNIQVEGVDEADIVKNDGKYIYSVSNGKVFIIDAYPAEEMNILSEIKIEARDIFINDDKLIILGSSYGYVSYENSYESVRCLGCGGYSSSNSMVYVYDISDRKNPKLENNISIEGNYVDSRMIGDYVYMISSKYVNSAQPEPPIYFMGGIKEKVSAEDVYYFDYPDTNYVFTSIIALNVENNDFNSKVYLTGSSSTIFVSENNIYLTYRKSFNWQDYNDRQIKEVYLVIAPNNLKEKIQEIADSDIPSYEKQNRIYSLIYEYSMSLKGNEKENFDKELQESLVNFEKKIQKERDKSVVHKINVDKEKIEYQGVGEVPGYILNQFSMDEYKGYFRVATTTGETWTGNSMNNVYVLNEDLEIVGSVEDLAEGESIYSARFIGDKGYLVTFKSVDPLFVIDLSNPENPKVLGYLKIPGYSDYLHPYDENHLIGIGKDVNESIDADKVHSTGAVYYTAILGLKVSLFDVSDFENPKEISKIIIGERGSDSPALRDHKALLFDKEKGILVLPVTVNKLVNRDYGDYSYEESEFVWQGAYVLNIDLNEISLRGKVSHDNYCSLAEDDPIGTERLIIEKTYVKTGEDSWQSKEKNELSSVIYTNKGIDNLCSEINRYGNYPSQIQRSLYMDDVLYTISQAKIKANNLNTIEEIKSLDLGYKEQVYAVKEDSVMVKG